MITYIIDDTNKCFVSKKTEITMILSKLKKNKYNFCIYVLIEHLKCKYVNFGKKLGKYTQLLKVAKCLKLS